MLGKTKRGRKYRLAQCDEVTFKKDGNGRKLPRSRWVTVLRCRGRKLKAHNRRQCRHKSGPRKGLYMRCR